MEISVRDAVATFIQEKEGQQWTPGVINRYRLDLNRFAEFCESKSINHLQDVKLPLLSAYRATWKEVYPSSRTQRKTQTRLRSFFRYAVAAEWIAHSCAQGMSTIKDKSKPTLPLDPVQYQALLDKLEVFVDSTVRKRMRALILLQRYAGLAIADAVNITRDQIQFQPARNVWRIVTSREKTGVSVYVPIQAHVAEEITALPDPMFPESLSQYHRRYRELFDKAGLPGGHSHQLRDTAAVEWLKSGIPLEEVSKLLGHSSIDTTEKHYAPWVLGRQERLEKIVMATW